MDGQKKGPGSRANATTEARADQVQPKYTTPQRQTEAGDFEILGEQPPLVAPGDYQVAFVDWWTGFLFFKAPKLGLTFQIVTPGSYFGAKVTRWYNVRKLIGRYGKRGRFQVGRRSEFLADYARFIGMPSRTDRVSVTHFASLILLAKIETVTVNHKQKQIADPLRYSVIRELIRVEVGA
jgi:hypothetical protein